MLTEYFLFGLGIELIQKDISFPIHLAHNISPVKNCTVRDLNRKCGTQPPGLDEDGDVWVSYKGAKSTFLAG